MTNPNNHLTLSRSTMIWVKWTLPGFHAWPDAPDEVAYLRSQHRHLFHFKVALSVPHDDREVEFHMLQNRCKSLYTEAVLELNNRSCEMIAKELLDKLMVFYGTARSYAVEVSEDDECGAVVTQVSY